MNIASERWVVFARQDLQMAELALKDGIYNQVCFHSKQCVEKCLKGLIVSSGKTPPRTHSIIDLLGVLAIDQLSISKEDMAMLDISYIPTRNPDTLPGGVQDSFPDEKVAIYAISTARLCWNAMNAQM